MLEDVDSCYSIMNTPVGIITLVCRREKLIELNFGEKHPASMQRDHSLITEPWMQEIQQYFEGKRKNFDLPFEINGTEFECRVWKTLCLIPYGETCSYKKVAECVGNFRGFRAVGMANSKNKIPIIIPCHRVISSDGTLGGYSGGLQIKRWLLNLESENK